MRDVVTRLSMFLTMMVLALATPSVWANAPVSLSGSPASMKFQNSVAKEAGFSFAASPDDVLNQVEQGKLIPLKGNEDYHVVREVSYPYARPEVKVFIERLAAQYHEATGEKLVVTSLTRPASSQPANSHALSVHPTGMAIDLRVSQNVAAQKWLEEALLNLEGKKVLDVTREKHPPHYHIALFPVAYMAYVKSLKGKEVLATALLPEAKQPEKKEAAADSTVKAQNPVVVVADKAEKKQDVDPGLTVLGVLMMAGGLGYFRFSRTTPPVK